MNKIVLLVLFIGSLTLKAQDPHFSQIFTPSMYLNPALTGSLNGWVANTQYRNQWPEIEGNYITTHFGLQKKLNKPNIGLGLSLLSDQEGGVISTTAVGFNFSKKWKFSDLVDLSTGLNTELRSRSVDWSELTFGSQINPQVGFTSTTNEVISTITYFNLSLGLDLRIQNANIGFVASNLLQPDESVYGGGYLPMRNSIYGRYLFELNDALSFIPVVKYENQGDFSQFVMGSSVRYKFITSFVGFRNEDAAIVGLGVFFNRFRFNYTYDITTSKLSNETGGAHEVGLIFRFGGGEEGYEDGDAAF